MTRGTLHDIMERSKDYAADLGAQLRERIYDDWYEVYTDTYETSVDPWRKRVQFLD